MKQRIFLFALIFSLSSINILAQLKIGYVDSEAVMKQLPDAIDAQKKIDTQIDEWQKELEDQ